ncbi:toprim domain-containing protein [Acidithiobacillus sp. HP-6]|uniref:toprim domain-containing protein n=1 Tax=unclassified Acidithiobacillus TaxID=2614800 RepID=UPI00187A59A4|nr:MULTISPECIES: toprim domain-containing protein [unclassified Acidithiobacillus]MBE7562322.1 toprim domain-containing protein [Acidithiobacillus sp. HP-6]MBE7569047.1 toprim domain-containing protein [Acidithiobacillus sp. HP-2]
MIKDLEAEFKNALIDGGIFLAVNTKIIPDGRLRRASAVNDKPGQLSIWYNLHLDTPASGVAGNWRTGARVKWSSKRQSALTATEKKTLRLRAEEERARAQAEQQARYHNAAERALKIWAASAPAAPQHPYLDRKGITPGIARQSGPSLVLPVVGFNGALHGLQFIHPDGHKRFLPGMSKAGHFIPTSEIPDGTRPLWIAEGWATASSLAAMKQDACHISALDCGNLANVAQAARAKWPGLEIVLAPDFDAIGQEKGRAAASAARAMILPMPARIPEGATDWNDIVAARRQGVGP